MEQVRLGSQGTSHVDARKAVKRAERDPWNRLLSIIKDAEWVAHFCQNELPTRLPVLPNLRCGAWYVPDFNRRAPSSPSLALGCYFKSTDGHTHAWGFSLKRYNLHVLEVVQERGGCIIVDSTRRGKSMPDALSKTVPIWCAVINKAVHKRHGWETDTATGGHLALPSRQREEAEDVLTNSDYSSLCTPEHIVSPSEHTQIAALIDGWASLLLASDLRIPKLDKPLHPIFVTKDRREAALAELEKQSLNHKSFPFYPLVLISASPAAATPSLEPRTEQIGKSCVPSPLRLPDHVEHALRRAAFVYVQGSGDDEEAWASHLTPQLFWNEDSLRTFVKTGGEPAAVQMFIDATLLQSKTAARTNCQRTEPSEDCSGINITAPKGSNYELHDGDVCIGTFPISLGRRAKRHTFGFSDLARYALIIHADGRCDPGDPEDQSDRLAKLGLESGKRGLSNFRASVPYVIVSKSEAEWFHWMQRVLSDTDAPVLACDTAACTQGPPGAHSDMQSRRWHWQRPKWRPGRRRSGSMLHARSNASPTTRKIL